MRIKELISEDLLLKFPSIYENREIKGITRDSREVQDDFLFFAIRGTKIDGHTFVEDVIRKGGIPVVEYGEGVVVKDVRKAYAESLKNFYGKPDEKLKIVGVTGTNGKTTTVYLLNYIFENSGIIGTIKYFDGKNEFVAQRTTPDSSFIYKFFSNILNNGKEYCFMEVSSHSISQKRIEGIYFSGGIFTNISKDHLDYHKTMENYVLTKLQFFKELPEDSFIIYNAEDPLGKEIGKIKKRDVISYGINAGVVRGSVLKEGYDGMDVLILHNNKKIEFHFPMIGSFNLKNLLAAYSVTLIYGVDSDEFIERIKKFPGVPGRMELVYKKPYIYIDYAHTPDALFNVLKSIRKFHKGKIITVFGAGGDRDKEKRPDMGYIVSELSDVSIITSDNPRTESPQDIIEDIKKGIKHKSYIEIVDRYEAIDKAIKIADMNDVILIAGKGHEDYQEINGEKLHFSDKEVVREILKNDEIA